MGRFIQQQIKTFVSRFVPTALCPKCGKPKPSLSLKKGQKKEEKEKIKRTKKEKKDVKD